MSYRAGAKLQETFGKDKGEDKRKRKINKKLWLHVTTMKNLSAEELMHIKYDPDKLAKINGTIQTIQNVNFVLIYFNK